MRSFFVLSLIFFSALLIGQEGPVKMHPNMEFKKGVTEMPRFPGCEHFELSYEEAKQCSDEKMLAYLSSNLKYPRKARRNSVQGMVIIQFVVEKDGFISNVKIAREIGAGCGDAAKEIVENMNRLPQRWIPGLMNGKLERVMFTLPIKFAI